MKNILLTLFLLLSFNAHAEGLYIDGRQHLDADVLSFRGMDEPSESPSNGGRAYFDDFDLTLKLSVDSGAYSDILTSLTGNSNYLRLDDGNSPTADYNWTTALTTTGTITAGILAATGLNSGSVVFSDGTNLIQDNANFFWDDTTKVLSSQTFNATNEDDILQVDGSYLLRTGLAANNNLFMGVESFNNADGEFNLGFGFRSGFINDTTGGGGNGTLNVYLGYRSGYGFDDTNQGFRNVGVGANTLLRNQTGESNVAIGFNSLQNNRSGSFNLAIGAEALTNNVVGGSNVAVGSAALKLHSGSVGANVAVGGTALGGVTTGFRNVGIGHNAGFRITIGFGNNHIGYQSGQGNNSGDYNIGIGYQALLGVNGNNHDHNVAIGREAGFSVTTGSDNIFLGHQAGKNQTTNSDLLIIDNQDRGSAAAETTDVLILGVFSATPASQSLRFNVGSTTFHNATHEDSDGGRSNQLNFKGQQSGGEETTLARIEISHDGAVDDEKGKVVISVNDGADGDTPTEVLEIDNTGLTFWKNTGGLIYGEIYAYNANDTITIAGTGIANKVQITSFTVNGLSNNIVPDHTNDHLTISKAGVYKSNVSIHAESTGGTAYQVGFAVYKNNGATLLQNCHAHRNLSGGGGDTGSISMTGLIDLAVDDTIEVWVWNETNTNDIIIDDITMNLIEIGA